MNVGFFPNLGKENILKTLVNAAKICRSLEMDVYLPVGLDEELPNIYEEMQIEKDHILENDALFKKLDMAFSLGGDGTIIHLAKQIFEYDIPVCGIN